MRQWLSLLLLAFACGASAAPDAAPDPDLVQAWPAWLVGDHVKARLHFRAAAQRGHPLGQYNLAMMLLHGEGGPRNPSEAEALLRKAADGGVELAREELGKLRIFQASTKCLSP